MAGYVLRRILLFVPTLLGVVLLVFLLFNVVGGDPAYMLAGKISHPAQIENIRTQLGIDQPYYVQLWIFLKQIATADFGVSWSTNERVSTILATRLGPSLTVLVPMLAIGTLLSMGAALLVAYLRHKNKITETEALARLTSKELAISVTFDKKHRVGGRLKWVAAALAAGGTALYLTQHQWLPLLSGIHR